MNLKAILIGIILILIISFGISRLVDNLKDAQEASTSSLKETIGLQKQARDLVDTSREQVKKREQMLDQE